MGEQIERPIEVKDLRKGFGSQAVLNGITLAVKRGETVSILGRSGTGKSVLLKLLVGIQQADSGSIQLQGQEVTGFDRNQWNETRKKIGFLFQQGALYDSLTIEQNVGFPMARHTKVPADERQERVRALLAKVGMEKDIEKMPSEISGGMQKRVGLARALILDPEILLFDEPTSGLDPITGAEISQLILDLKKERQTTSLVVTHDLHASQLFTDRFILIHQGEIRGEGGLADLQKSEDPFVAKFIQETGY